MRARVDSTKCGGYGVCADVCPTVFETDEFGYAAVHDGGSVSPDREAEAAQAAESCPEGAITLEA